MYALIAFPVTTIVTKKLVTIKNLMYIQSYIAFVDYLKFLD